MITYGRVWLNPLEAFFDLQTKNMRLIAGVNKIQTIFFNLSLILNGARCGVVVKAHATNRQVAGSIPDGVIGISQ